MSQLDVFVVTGNSCTLTVRVRRVEMVALILFNKLLLAQLDRAQDFYSWCWRFESSAGGQFFRLQRVAGTGIQGCGHKSIWMGL
jgi:hypothetical protein